MLFFPNCKINLGLTILRKRPDGYHDLETVFYPLPLKDALELIPTGDNEPTFNSYGLPIPGDPAGNLCLKAWRLTKKDFPDLPAIDIHLYKNIPIGAGLGGGSADGAGTLTGLNRLFQLNLSHEQLLGYAAQLGSDCPFFVLNTPCLGQGRGERLQPLPLDLSSYSFALVDPGIHISTAQAFALCTPHETNSSLPAIVSRPIETWTGSLINDFEEPLLNLHPELHKIKETFHTAGALYTSLTGSGSSFFGIFQKHKVPLTSPFHKSYNYRILP
jgi:4-diphosphocytidyl-2-C-methyl-D-erythritol kinase